MREDGEGRELKREEKRRERRGDREEESPSNSFIILPGGLSSLASLELLLSPIEIA